MGNFSWLGYGIQKCSTSSHSKICPQCSLAVLTVSIGKVFFFSAETTFAWKTEKSYTPNPITVTHARTVRWDVLRCPSTPVSPATLSACFIAFVISGLAVARRHVTARGTRDGARQAHLRAAPTELAEQQVAHPLQRLLRA